MKKALWLYDIYKTDAKNTYLLTCIDEKGDLHTVQVDDFKFSFSFLIWKKEQQDRSKKITRRTLTEDEYDDMLGDLFMHRYKGKFDKEKRTLFSYIHKKEYVQAYAADRYQKEPCTFVKVHMNNHNDIAKFKSGLYQSLREYQEKHYRHKKINLWAKFYESKVTKENKFIIDNGIQVCSWLQFDHLEAVRKGVSKVKNRWISSYKTIHKHEEFNRTNKAFPPIKILSTDIEVHTLKKDRFPIPRWTHKTAKTVKMDYEEVLGTETDPVSVICCSATELFKEGAKRQPYIFSYKDGTIDQEKYQKICKAPLDKVIFKKYNNEYDMLMGFLDFVQKNQFTILTGWYTDYFDFDYIFKRLVMYDESIHQLVRDTFRVKLPPLTDSYKQQVKFVGNELIKHFQLEESDTSTYKDFKKVFDMLSTRIVNNLENKVIKTIMQKPHKKRTMLLTMVDNMMASRGIVHWRSKVLDSKYVTLYMKKCNIKDKDRFKQELDSIMVLQIKQGVIDAVIDKCIQHRHKKTNAYTFIRKMNLFNVDAIYNQYTINQKSFNQYFLRNFDVDGIARKELEKNRRHWSDPSNNLLDFTNMPGRILLDGLAIWIQENYRVKMGRKLDEVANSVLGDQKVTIGYNVMNDYWESDDPEKIGQVFRYCFKDADLPIDILVKQKLFMHTFQIVRLGNITVHEAKNKKKTCIVFHVLLNETKNNNFKDWNAKLKKWEARKYMIPDWKPKSQREEKDPFKGAKVFEPWRGYNKAAIKTFDFFSLYPSIIIWWNLCYTTYITKQEIIDEGLDIEKDVYTFKISGENKDIGELHPNGKDRIIYFVKPHIRQGLLPVMCQKVLDARGEKKKQLKKVSGEIKKILDKLNTFKEGSTEYKKYQHEIEEKLKELRSLAGIYDAIQLAIKVIANSIYGYTGYQGAELINRAISAVITSMGVMSITFLKDMVENSILTIDKQAEFIKTDTGTYCSKTCMKKHLKKETCFLEHQKEGNCKKLHKHLLECHGKHCRKEATIIDEEQDMLDKVRNIYCNEKCKHGHEKYVSGNRDNGRIVCDGCGIMDINGKVPVRSENIHIQYNTENRSFLKDFNSYKKYYDEHLDCGNKALENHQKSFNVRYGDSVTGDTPILCRNPTNNMIFYRTIDHLTSSPYEKKGDKEYNTTNLEVWTEQGFTKIEQIIRHKTNKTIYRVLTHTGVVDVTEDHSLLDKNANKLRPKDVKIGNQLLHSNFPTPTNAIKTISKEEAFVWGLFMADGTAGTYQTDSGVKYQWTISKSDKNLLMRTKGYLDKLYEGDNKQGFKILDTMKSSKVYKLVPTLTIKSMAIKYRKLFYHGVYKMVPDIIMNSTKEIQTWFIKGYYCGDGDKQCSRSDIKGKIGAASLYFLYDRIGNNVSINTRKDKTDIFRLTFSKNRFRKHAEKIKKIEKQSSDDQYVYDLQTKNHHFAAGIGKMIVHNTDSIMMQTIFPKPYDKYPCKIAIDHALCYQLERKMNTMFNHGTKMRAEFEDYKIKSILLAKKMYNVWKIQTDKFMPEHELRYDENDDECVQRVKPKVLGMGSVLKRGDSIPFVKRISRTVMNLLLTGVKDPKKETPLLMKYNIVKVKQQILKYLHDELYGKLLRNNVRLSEFRLKAKYDKRIEDYPVKVMQKNGISREETFEDRLNRVGVQTAMVEIHKKKYPDYQEPPLGTYVFYFFCTPSRSDYRNRLKSFNNRDYIYRQFTSVKANKIAIDPKYFVKDISKSLNIPYYFEKKVISPMINQLKYIFKSDEDIELIKNQFKSVQWYKQNKKKSKKEREEEQRTGITNINLLLDKMIFGNLFELLAQKYSKANTDKIWGKYKLKRKRTAGIDLSDDLEGMKKEYQKCVEICKKCIANNDSPIASHKECETDSCTVYVDKGGYNKYINDW